MKTRSIRRPGLPMPDFSNTPLSDRTAPGVPAGLEAPPTLPPGAGSPIDIPPSTVDSPGRDYREIPIDCILPNRFAPRTIYTEKMLREMAEDLAACGRNNDPVHVIPSPERPGYFIIADGWTRVRACEEYKALGKLLAEIHHDMGEQEASWFGYKQNDERNPPTDYDKALFYKKHLDDGIPQVEIARRAGVSPQLLSNYMAFLRLPEEVIDLIQQNGERFGSNAATHLARVYEHCGVRRTVTLAEKFVIEDKGVRWLAAQMAALTTSARRSSTKPIKSIRYANGHYKQWEKGSFQIEVKDVPAEKCAEFAQALEDLLNTVTIDDPTIHEGGDTPPGA